MAHIAISGRLAKDPVQKQTKAGKPMTSAFFIGELETMSDEDLSFPASLMAFGFSATALASVARGDYLTVSGRMQTRMYEGVQRFTIVVDSIVSAKSVRPKGGKAKSWPEQEPSVSKLYSR